TFFTSGIVRRNGLLLEANWISMSNPSAGLADLANWLCENRCLGIRYEFIGSFGGDDEPGDE
ncbi:MAG TPA: hypothetical protein VN761_10960, partial [Candidatus Polarisedimenticolia bacterium]|nr:hypothetical protein [Candidatus Polarisedimenticolia bacterium]